MGIVGAAKSWNEVRTALPCVYDCPKWREYGCEIIGIPTGIITHCPYRIEPKNMTQKILKKTFPYEYFSVMNGIGGCEEPLAIGDYLVIYNTGFVSYGGINKGEIFVVTQDEHGSIDYGEEYKTFYIENVSTKFTHKIYGYNWYKYAIRIMKGEK